MNKFSWTFAIVAITAFLLIQWGVFQGRQSMRQEAILNKAAHYAIDTNGNPTFTWNTPTP